MSEKNKPYRVYGMTQSYFTRKLTGYLDYKGIPWLLCRTGAMHPEAAAAGWPGGIPAAQTPQGEFMWDTTAMIHHLERRFPELPVLPADPVQAFLGYVIEDFSDEWLYRPAVGTRWHFAENTSHAGWDLAREITVQVAVSCDQARELAFAHVRSSCPPLGVTEESIQSWVDEVLKPWLRVLGAHLARRRFLFGERPSLADFAVFGGNVAHFINDPVCRRWVESEGPAIVPHTHRLLEPHGQDFGGWSDPDDIPDTLIHLLSDIGRLYLPWVSRATADGVADLAFEHGPRVPIRATDFLVEARAVLLGRYAALRCDALDAVLQRAGIRSYFADFAARAGAVPGYESPPQPALNRPFPPADV
jgi:glutathione S-transferase